MDNRSLSAWAQAEHPSFRRSQGLSRIDWLWADFLLEESDCPSIELGLSALFLSCLVRSGSSTLPLKRFAEKPLVPECDEVAFPSLGDWLASLARAPDVVGSPGDYKPLILVDNGDGPLLYLHRFYTYEQAVASFAERMSNKAVLARPQLEWGRLGDGLSGEQRLAIEMGFRRHLTLLSGGPGTGKTSTLTVFIRLYYEWFLKSTGRKPTVLMLAPTGKAALRVKSSFSSQAASLNLPSDWALEVAENTQTIHRYLRSGFRSHDPKKVGVVVVDEFSMVSLQLFFELISILGNGPQYFLVGDKNQLGSVEAATLMKDFTLLAEETRYSESFSREFGAYLKSERGADDLSPERVRHPFRDNIALLGKSYRFGEGSFIGLLSDAVNRQDQRQTSLLLSQASSSSELGVRFESAERFGDLLRVIRSILLPHYRSFYAELARAKQSPDVLQKVLGSFYNWGVLSAVRTKGFGSARHLNAAIESLLSNEGVVRLSAQPQLKSSSFYEGRPVMVVENSYATNLFNGDVGFCLLLKGERKVVFAVQGDAVVLNYERLPRHETCYAMTVHKSQGSEFGSVLFVLPESPSPVLTKELLYTAITRARKRLFVVGKQSIFMEAAATKMERHSGLPKTLWQLEAPSP